MEGMGTTVRVGEGLAMGESRYYANTCLPGIIGCIQSKYIPTDDMSAGYLRLEITLANNNDWVTIIMTYTTAASRKWTVSDVKLMLKYAEYNPETSRMISA